MKIKDVCLRTGLTDRTIRFYIEKGLLNAHTNNSNGKNFREYSEDDVEILNDIAKLRKAKFSVQDILDMQNENRSLDEVVSSHCKYLEQEQYANEIIVEKLKKMDGRKNLSWRKLANLLYSDQVTQSDKFRFSTYDEPVIIEYSRNTKNYLKMITVACVACIVLFASTVFAIRHWYNQRELFAFFAISEVEILDKWMEDGKKFVLVSTNSDAAIGYDSYFFEERALRIKNIDYYNAMTVGDAIYQSISIRIEIPYGEAKKLGLLGADGNVSLEKVLSSEDYIKSYCVIESMMQDDKYYK